MTQSSVQQQQRKIIVLDDMEDRHQGFKKILPDAKITHAYTMTGFFRMYVEEYPPGGWDLVCLDHDLEGYEERDEIIVPLGGDSEGVTFRVADGRDVARAIVNDLLPDKRPKRVLIHSWNPDGAKEMEAILRDGGINNVVRREYKAP